MASWRCSIQNAEARNIEGDIDELFDHVRADPEEFLAAGELVIVPFRLSGVARASGLPVDLHATYVFTVRDGKAVRWTPYRGKREALAAVRSEADTSRGE